MTVKNKKLRSGYTTGACAAAAAKAATLRLLSSEFGVRSSGKIKIVEIPFPDRTRVSFKVHSSGFNADAGSAFASVIKDAGDDPDVTNNAEIVAEVSLLKDTETRRYDDPETGLNSFSPLPPFAGAPSLIIRGEKGVGVVTKPGLQVPVGEPAINPVPRRMITEAVMEAMKEFGSNDQWQQDDRGMSLLGITISVPEGERIAKRTLNSRLGIIGGISILGTTGIVKPLSSEAWTASITAAMDVAKAMDRDDVVLSSGRASERIHMEKFNLPVESYIMMGDYIEFSLLDAVKHNFRRIHLCSQWAKMIKIAMATPQTHVRHGAIDMRKTVQFLNRLGIDIPQDVEFNTAREMHDLIISKFRNPEKAFLKVCAAAKEYVEKTTGGYPVAINLVLYNGDVIVYDE